MERQRTTTDVVLPRIAITFCTQCKWTLRAAYYMQELLSTFGASIGEIALIPSTGGVFQVHVTTQSEAGEATETLVWDRKAESGFPETKILKQKIRNLIEPGRDLGHSDTPSKTQQNGAEDGNSSSVVELKQQDAPTVLQA